MSIKKQSCILHFGTAKTGTTALQFGLANYDDGETTFARLPIAPDNPNQSEPLVLAGFGEADIQQCIDDYPKWMASGDKLRWPNSVPMKFMLRTKRPPDVQIYKTALAESITSVPHRRLIYSGEALFGNPRCADGLIGQFRENFDQIDAVCYLRTCAGAFLSRFKQRLTAADPVMFYSDGMSQDLNQLIYRDAFYLKQWKEALADENLYLAIYSPKALKNGDIIDDFCDRMKLDASRARRIRTNVSFGAEATAVLATISYFGNVPADNSHFERNKRYFNVLMSQFGTGKLSLSDAFADRLHDANKDALDWIDQQCGQEFTRAYSKGSHVLGKHEDLLDICHGLIPELTEFLVARAGREFRKLPRDIKRFGEHMSRILSEPDPFPTRQLPDGFSGTHYLALNPDLARAQADPEQHFLHHGCFEGRFY